MLLLALAAPVFAESSIFFKNPVFFVLGVVRPPKTPDESPLLLCSDHGTADIAPCLDELWLEWYEIPVSGVCGLKLLTEFLPWLI